MLAVSNGPRVGWLVDHWSRMPSPPSCEPPPSGPLADWNTLHGVPDLCRGSLLKPLVKPGPDLVRRQLRALPLLTGDDDSGCRDTGETGKTNNLPEVHEQEHLAVE